MEHEPTRKALLRALLEGPRTALSLAEEVGVDTAAARRHLDGFVAAGLAKALFRQEGMGRPKKYYEITEAGRETFPRRYDLLLASVAEAAIASHGSGAFAELMDRVAEALAREHGARVPRHAPLAARVRAVASVLRELGFPTEIEERDGRVLLVRRDCVFLKVAMAHQDAVCNHLDTGFLSRVLGEPVELVQCIPAGDGVCRHEIRARAAKA